MAFSLWGNSSKHYVTMQFQFWIDKCISVEQSAKNKVYLLIIYYGLQHNTKCLLDLLTTCQAVSAVYHWVILLFYQALIVSPSAGLSTELLYVDGNMLSYLNCVNRSSKAKQLP